MANYGIDVIFRDLDLELRPNLSSDIAPVAGLAALRRSIINVLKMRPLDIPYDNGQYVGLDGLLFESASNALSATIADNIKETLQLREPRIEVNDVQVAFDEQLLHIQITFLVVATQTEHQEQFIINRSK